MQVHSVYYSTGIYLIDVCIDIGISVCWHSIHVLYSCIVCDTVCVIFSGKLLNDGMGYNILEKIGKRNSHVDHYSTWYSIWD